MVEWHSTETASALEAVRAELRRFVEHGPQRLTASAASPETEALGVQMENLAMGVKLLVAAVRGVSTDILHIKKNISAIENTTR